MSSRILDYRQICSRVRDVALEAGVYIAGQRKNFALEDVEFKGEHNLVSYVDREAERVIVSRLKELIPGSGFITEEGTALCEGQNLKWIIDPLDGTTNFVHGLPPYCVSIALMEGDEVVVGVVYEITLKEMFWAWKGSAAWMNGETISASKVDKLENALIAIGFSYTAFERKNNYMDTVAWYQRNTDGIRRLGSSTADLVYVACGRVDAFSQFGLSPWDVAAGGLIARCAGAVVTDSKGGDDYIFSREVVAAAPAIYPEFIKTVK